MNLPTAVYTANRGYAWSNVPEGISTAKLNEFCRMISSGLGEFGECQQIESGLVSDGKIAAAFTKQRVERWDAEGRSADYVALALFPIERSGDIDVLELLNHDFFWTPERTPRASVEYVGPAAEKPPVLALIQLLRESRCTLESPRSLGAILANCGDRSAWWKCRTTPEGKMDVTCCGLDTGKEPPK